MRHPIPAPMPISPANRTPPPFPRALRPALTLTAVTALLAAAAVALGAAACSDSTETVVADAACQVPAADVLAALERAFGPIESCMITTMQAISGAGYPGVPSLDIVDNIVPYISGEEEKIEWETLKILGGLTQGDDGLKAFDMHTKQPLRISASCNRVPVIEGHTECVGVRFARRPPPSPQQVREALQAYTSEAYTIGCPSAPRHTVFVHEEADRPQPRLDRDYQLGAGVSVGRVRQCRVLDIKFVVLANNVAIGAATSSIINAEYAVLKGIVSA